MPLNACRQPFGPERVAEEDLCRLWFGGAFARRGLRTRCGRRVRVLYRGLPNGDRGPDYLGAVLSLGRCRPRAGDIELHLRSSQWRVHGHHRDSHYEGVILHVVWLDDDPHPTLLPSGRQVPVLALGGLGGGPGYAGEPCRQALGRGRLGEALDQLGEDRFLGKAARLEGEMAALPAQEVLYQALAEALGYAHNKGPFRRLAASLPLGLLEGFLWGKAPARQEALAQALLLGAAGLLPSQGGPQAGHEWPAHLEELWRAYALEPPLIGPQKVLRLSGDPIVRSAKCEGSPGKSRRFAWGYLGRGDWALGVRPENHPARRLAGLASLVVGSLGKGLVPWALGLLVQAPRNPAWWRILVREAQGYWRDHFDFGRPGPLSPSLIGRGRALEMAVNALLPFTYAYGQALGDEKLSRAALEAYALLPSPGSNQITRHMERQLLGAYHASLKDPQKVLRLSGDPSVPLAHHGGSPGKSVRFAWGCLAGTARRQQGLLHLFRAYCTQGRCRACPLACP